MKTLVLRYAVLFLLIAIALVIIDRKRNRAHIDHATTSTSTYVPLTLPVDHYIRSMATTTDVSPGITPVLIYSRHASMKKDIFFGSGIVIGSAQEPLLFTAEHLLGPHVVEDRSFRVVPLRGTIDSCYATAIIASGNLVAPAADIVVFTLGQNEHFFKPYSKYSKDGYVKMNFGIPIVNGKSVTKVTSVVSGKTYNVLALGQHETAKGMMIMVDYLALEGESGSGFVDTNGYGWIFSHGAGTTLAETESHQANCVKETGKRATYGFSFLAGPVLFTTGK